MTGLLLFLNVLTLLFWFFQAQDRLAWVGAGLVLALAATLVAVRQVRRQPVARLQWDGRTWHLHESVAGGAGVSGQLTARFDAQRFLLAELRAEDGRRHWLTLSAAADPARWGALRCAWVASAVPAQAIPEVAGVDVDPAGRPS